MYFTARVFLLILFLPKVVMPQSNVTVKAGGSTGEITCDLSLNEELPLWIINGDVYELSSMYFHFSSVAVVHSIMPLSLVNVTEDLSNTTLQCAIFGKNNLIKGRCTVIYVYSNPEFDGADGASEINSLDFNYQELDIQMDATTVGWTAVDICNPLYQLQGFLLNTTLLFHPGSVFETNMTNNVIPSRNLTIEGRPVYYRLVAVALDRLICSEKRALDTYYRFDASQFRITEVLAPNTRSCYSIPKTDICRSSIVFVMQGRRMNSVICPIHNSSFGQTAFESCIARYDIDPLPQFSSGSVCLSDKNSTSNGTSVHFACSTTPCSDCIVQTILSSFLIIISGPPSVTNYTYNGSSLCISASSHKEFPVESFSVNVSDITGIPTSISGRYAVSSNKICISLISDSTPRVCLPLSANASAANQIGESLPVQLTIGNSPDCNCYQHREQTLVHISKVSSDSAVAHLVCSRQETSQVNYDLMSEDKIDSRTIAITCGESRNFTSLIPDVKYLLLRNYSDNIQCVSASFQTDQTSEEYNRISVILGFVSFFTIVVIFIAMVYLFLYCKFRRRRSYYPVTVKNNYSTNSQPNNCSKAEGVYKLSAENSSLLKNKLL